MAASVKVAQVQIALMATTAFGTTAYAPALLKNTALENSSNLSKLSRFLCLFVALLYIIPGCVHRFKHDAGILSIGEGKGWKHVKIPPESVSSVMFAKMWGKQQMLIGALLVYIELWAQKHVSHVSGIVMVSAWHDLLFGIEKKGNQLMQKHKEAPGRHRSKVVAAFSTLGFLLSSFR